MYNNNLAGSPIDSARNGHCHAERQTQIAEALSMQRNRLEELDGMISQLRERLAPVSQPLPAVLGGPCDEKAPPTAPIANVLNVSNGRIQALIHTVMGMIQNLEV